MAVVTPRPSVVVANELAPVVMRFSVPVARVGPSAFLPSVGGILAGLEQLALAGTGCSGSTG